MQRPLVAFQGHLGAYGNIAAVAAFPTHDPLPVGSFEEVFDAVASGRADHGIVPVENSRAGRVTDIHRLLHEHIRTDTKLYIIGEHYQPVRHHLLVVPGTTWEELRRARSHPQALMQCRLYLGAKGLTPEASTDTAGAAQEVARQGDRSVAAVASSLAGELYGLTSLAEDIADAPDNTTRFLKMARERCVPPPTAERVINACWFEVRNIPAALYKALGGFATNGVNLVKLESYQLDGFQWNGFNIEFEGHPEDGAVRRALDELAHFAKELQEMGSWEAHADRPTSPDDQP